MKILRNSKSKGKVLRIDCDQCSARAELPLASGATTAQIARAAGWDVRTDEPDLCPNCSMFTAGKPAPKINEKSCCLSATVAL